jgi:histidinol-phosphate aminotransferase
VPLRDALANVQPFRPQRPMHVLQAELGLERIVKLASNESAFGPVPAATAAYEAAVAELNRYPDAGGLALREQLAERHGVSPWQVVLGNGADELIRLCAVATLDAGDRAAFPWPSFPSYISGAACSGGSAVPVPLRPDRSFDLDALLAEARAGARLVYIANPNNPTGTSVDPGELRAFIADLPEKTLLVLDEAYAEYAEPEPEGIALVRAGAERLCSLRTFSKVYGLAALRIGYAIASPPVADALDRVRPVFNVNQPAQEAAIASLSDGTAIADRVAHTRRGRDFLFEALSAAGFRAERPNGNFVYADVPDGRDGAGVADALLREGVIVRSLEGFGAPGAIRVTAGTDEENRIFARALDRVAPMA